jgi:hypothetical protein
VKLIPAEAVPGLKLAICAGSRLTVTLVPDKPLVGETLTHDSEDTAVQASGGPPVVPKLTVVLSALGGDAGSIVKMKELGDRVSV